MTIRTVGCRMEVECRHDMLEIYRRCKHVSVIHQTMESGQTWMYVHSPCEKMSTSNVERFL